MSLTVTRNPNLTRPLEKDLSNHELEKQFGERWWTGLAPQNCPGFDKKRECLVALPLLNLQICSRQDVLDYFNNTWTLTELLFQGLKNEQAYIRPPYHQLRHPLIFYYGHPAVLFINKLRVAGLLSEPLNLYIEKVLETGVDEMSWDDMSKNEMAWPSVQTVHEYRKKVYDVITHLIKTHPDLDLPPGDRPFLQSSPLWALWMGMEHEKIHFETSSVLIRELPLEFVTRPRYWAPLHPSMPATLTPPPAATELRWQEKQGTTVHVGKAASTPSFGWDNEYGQREVAIKDFKFTDTLISNGEFYEFVSSGAYVNDSLWSAEGLAWRKFRNTKRPTFWAAVGPEGSHEYALRTIFEFIPMPWNWPAEVNFHEAQAYCRWREQKDHNGLHYRLLSEAEFVSLRHVKQDPVLQTSHYSQAQSSAQTPANFNFYWSSASPVDAQIEGNVWHWLEDQFNPLENFKPHPFYDDFSTPCFDGKHQMIAGGSFISCGHEASQWARFHFRPHFYQHAGFRMAATLDGSWDNGSTKLVTDQTYVHPRREQLLDQMSLPDWWKHVDQPMELTSGELKKYFTTTEKYIEDFQQNFEKMPPMGTAHDPSLNSIAPSFALPYQSTKDLPTRPEDYEKLLQFIFKEMAPLSQLPGHPGYVAYVAGAGNMLSNLGQLISQTLNPFSSHFMMAPGLVTLEAEVLQWFIRLMEFPAQTAGGYLTTGSSTATMSALSMARQKKVLGQDYSKQTLYVSDQAHHCIAKAWVMLGFAGENIRLIPSLRPSYKINTEALKQAIADDVKKGLQPFCVVGSAGTTNTGAVDDLREIAALAKQQNMWFHVDGAYGALFKLTQPGSTLLQGIELADSLVFDLHKALALSYGTGCLLVRDKQDMYFSYPGAKTYMPPAISEDEQGLHVDFADISPELSRDYRGLRVWLPLKTWGVAPFTLNLEEKLKLSEWMYQELQQIPEVEIMAAPQLSIQTWTLKLSSDVAKNNEATQQLLERINHRGTLFVSACTLDNRKGIRFCFLGFRLHHALLQKALHEIKQDIAEIKKTLK